MSSPYRHRVIAFLGCAMFSALACTFPDVTYEDAGATTTAGSGCSASTTCAADAQKCGDDARKQFDACTHPCMNKQACVANCQSALTIDLGQCDATCQSCAAGQGCSNATASCKALVGG